MISGSTYGRGEGLLRMEEVGTLYFWIIRVWRAVEVLRKGLIVTYSLLQIPGSTLAAKMEAKKPVFGHGDFVRLGSHVRELFERIGKFCFFAHIRPMHDKHMHPVSTSTKPHSRQLILLRLS